MTSEREFSVEEFTPTEEILAYARGKFPRALEENLKPLLVGKDLISHIGVGREVRVASIQLNLI